MLPAACVTVLLSTLLLWSPSPVVSTTQACLLLGVTGALATWRLGVRGLVLSILAGLPVVIVVVTSASVLRDRWPEERAQEEVEVTGELCDFPRVQPGSWRFVLDTEAESRARGVPARVLVSWYDSSMRPAAVPQPGQRWHLRLRLRRPRGLVNPGGFDYERWLFAQGIGATAWVRDAALNRPLSGNVQTCRVAGWRAEMAGRISEILKGRDAAPWVLGLALGAYQALPEGDWGKLRRTGTVHLISISGFHIALIAGPAALIGRQVARVLLSAGRRCRPPVIASWTALLAASLYAALAGFSVPTMRAVIGVMLVAVGVSCRRALTAPELLGLTALAVLLVEPLSILVPGFWLSFSGVAVLLVIAKGLRSDRLRSGALRILLVTQLGITIGLAPLLVLFYGQLPLSGAMANLVAVPAFSIVLLPLTLVGSALVMLAPAAGAFLLAVAADCFDLWRDFLGWCAGLPLAVWYLPEPAPLALLLAGIGAALALWPPPSPGRWLGFTLLIGVLGSSQGVVPPDSLRMTVLDVGQGLAVLVQTSRHALLYDTGPAFRNSDAGERVVVPALQALGVKRLDMLMISHSDADHRGGAASVLERYPASRIVGPAVGNWPSTPCREGFAWAWDGIDFEVLHPGTDAGGRSDNDQSCVLRISGAGVRLLFPGDIEAPAEEELVMRLDFRGADLVLAPHHGSRTSSSAGFVRATRPRFVVFSTGYGNRWHFPVADVVDRWRESGACGLSTADWGALQFVVSPEAGLRLVRRERALAHGLWLTRSHGSGPCL